MIRAGWRRVLVWDLPVRLFHWITVALILTLYLTQRFNMMDWHILAGEALLALVIFRLIWGFVGSETARFSHFVGHPIHAVRHLLHFHHREPHSGIGHNAAGGWMVVLLIALVFLECLSGVYVNNDVANEGGWSEVVPAWFSDLVSNLHTWLWEAILAAVILHVCVVAAYAAVKRHDLVRPMVTGCKYLPADLSAPRLAPLWRAALSLLVAIGIAVGIVAYL